MASDLSLPGLLEVLSFTSFLVGFGFALSAGFVLSADALFARSFTATAGVLAMIATGMHRLASRERS